MPDVIGNDLKAAMFNLAYVHFGQPWQPVAHQPAHRMGLLQLIGDGAEGVADPAGTALGDADLLTQPAEHQAYRVDGRTLALLAESLAHPRLPVCGAEDERGVRQVRP
jgi:hypothetical protein